jgi:hypothetical protein
MVRLVLDKVYSCLRSWPRLRFCFVSYFFSILLVPVIPAPAKKRNPVQVANAKAPGLVGRAAPEFTLAEMGSRGIAVVLVAFDDAAKVRDFLVKKKLDVASILDEPGNAALYGALDAIHQ